MYNIDTTIKQEALNFATLMNVLRYTEHRLEPLFNELAESVDIHIPLIDNEVQRKCADFFNVLESDINREYKLALHAFSLLRPEDEIIKRGSINYPPLLGKTEQAPRFLYIRGKKSLLFENRTVAIVGSRQASEKSKVNTRTLTKILCENGITIVSGLAKGIDVTAHKEALRGGYNTIAVIGTNLNQYYPAENKNIQLEIEKMGLVVSQFSPATKTERWFFPLRNGVMSGLSLATIIMEAGETSGALKQADFALKQGRQIIIPQNILRQKEVLWPKNYIHKGASVVASPSDVLKRLSENNVIKYNKTMSLTQRTLNQYIEELNISKSSYNKTVWKQPMVIW